MQASKEKASVEGKSLNTRQQSHTLAAAAAAKRSKNELKRTDRTTDQRRDKLLELQRKVKEERKFKPEEEERAMCNSKHGQQHSDIILQPTRRNVTQSSIRKQ